MHLECYDASLGVLRRWRQKYFEERGQPFVYMALLTIVPEAQRKGVGSALLREGLKEVIGGIGRRLLRLVRGDWGFIRSSVGWRLRRQLLI